MNISIDVDQEKAQKALTARERLGVYLIYLMFHLIYPARYNHQLKVIDEMLRDLKG